jgi:hypothetical protein
MWNPSKMKPINYNKTVYSLMNLIIEMERGATPDDVRSVIKTPPGLNYYNTVVDAGGLDVVAWLGKTIIKMKEQQNEKHSEG